MIAIDAVCFDFFNTLATHRAGRGRGSRLMEYLKTHGLESDRWEHQVLYDVFEPHAREYSPTHPPEVRHAYYCRLASRVFERLNVRAPKAVALGHAAGVWNVLGPASLQPFPEAQTVLRGIKRAGIRTAVVSNWQCGLAHFCVELGFGGELDHVVASAEVGVAKPDHGIFAEALRRLGTSPGRTLHVGDTIREDVEGAQRAGLRAVLVQRSGAVADAPCSSVTSLEEILDLLGIAPSSSSSRLLPGP